jgi:hypothetical protein
MSPSTLIVSIATGFYIGLPWYPRALYSEMDPNSSNMIEYKLESNMKLNRNDGCFYLLPTTRTDSFLSLRVPIYRP